MLTPVTRFKEIAGDQWTLLKQYAIRQSMGRKGNGWESLPFGYNAVSKSLFHTLKTELIYHQTFRNWDEARQAVFEYIEVFYNRERLHSINGYLLQVDYEWHQKAA